MCIFGHCGVRRNDSCIIVNKDIRVPSRADAGTSGTAYILEQPLSVRFIIIPLFNAQFYPEGLKAYIT